MKRFLLALACLVSVSAFATTLSIPLFVEGVPVKTKKSQKKQKKNQTTKMPMAWFNKTVKKAGMKPLPEWIEHTPGKDVVDTSGIDEQLNEVAEKLGKAYEGLQLASEGTPNENRAGNFSTCYTGRGDGVWAAVADLTDVYYSDQMGLFGWKYKKQTVLDESMQDDENKAWLNKNSKLWKKWRGDDDSVLVVTHQGDGGDDVNDAIIDRCDD